MKGFVLGILYRAVALVVYAAAANVDHRKIRAVDLHSVHDMTTPCEGDFGGLHAASYRNPHSPGPQ
jgi:hypothetical protein